MRPERDWRTPERGTIWRHYKGGLYIVLDSGMKEDDPMITMVLYQNLETGDKWLRSVTQWYEVISERNGTQLSRFTRCAGRVDI